MITKLKIREVTYLSDREEAFFRGQEFICRNISYIRSEKPPPGGLEEPLLARSHQRQFCPAKAVISMP